MGAMVYAAIEDLMISYKFTYDEQVAIKNKSPMTMKWERSLCKIFPKQPNTCLKNQRFCFFFR